MASRFTPQTTMKKCRQCDYRMIVPRNSAASTCQKCIDINATLLKCPPTPISIRMKYQIKVNNYCNCNDCSKLIPGNANDGDTVIKYILYPVVPGFLKPEDVDDGDHILNQDKIDLYPTFECRSRRGLNQSGNMEGYEPNIIELVSVKLVKSAKRELFA
jgi:hypothetical protein